MLASSRFPEHVIYASSITKKYVNLNTNIFIYLCIYLFLVISTTTVGLEPISHIFFSKKEGHLGGLVG